MKKFEHLWTSDFFLLHIQINNPEGKELSVRMVREFSNGKTNQEDEQIKKGTESHRFIISKSHPLESRIRIEYPNDVILEAYKVDDRAYYPTESFFVH